MITDPRVFEEEFVPRDVKHRDAESNRIEQALAPVVDGERGNDVYLFGPPGTGKTTVARYLLDTLGRAAPTHTSHYLNCWCHSSRYDVLYRLAKGLTGAIDIHRTSTPADDLLDRLGRIDGQSVAILDEVDMLDDPDVLYDLYHVPNLTLVHIANREVDLFGDLPDRVTSRLRVGYRIAFDRYDEAELVGILIPRVDAGLAPDAIDRPLVERIAREADGDARVAIAVLRTAARMAEGRCAERITDSIVEDALPRALDDGEAVTSDGVDEHRQALLDILAEADGGVQPNRLYTAYADRLGSSARSRRTVQKYLKQLVDTGRIDDEGASQSRRYHARGRSRNQGAKPP